MDHRIIIEISPKILTLFICFIISIYSIYHGLKVIFYDETYLSPSQRAGLWILKFYNPKSAYDKKQELLINTNQRRIGIGLLIIGTSALIIGVLYIFWT
jgi:hypothetical protein